MKLEKLNSDMLWHCYQRGYGNLMRSGAYFRQLLRPELSHAYFNRALPLLQDYAASNHGELQLPPGFRNRLEACPLSPRDLLHLDYAICLGYVELKGLDPSALAESPVFQWPGPLAGEGIFIAADALLTSGIEMIDDVVDDIDDDNNDLMGEPDEGESTPPFDL